MGRSFYLVTNNHTVRSPSRPRAPPWPNGYLDDEPANCTSAQVAKDYADGLAMDGGGALGMLGDRAGFL